MAMEKATGVDGDIDFISGHNACFDIFEMERMQQLINTSCFGEDEEDFTGSTQGGSCHAEGTIKYNATDTAPGVDAMSKTGGAVTLTYAPACTHVFNLVLSSIRTRVVKLGESRVTFDGRMKGALVETWDESSS